MVPRPLMVHAVIEPHCHFWILDHGFIMDSKIQSPGMSEMLKIAIVIFLLHHCLTARTLQGAMFSESSRVSRLASLAFASWQRSWPALYLSCRSKGIQRGPRLELCFRNKTWAENPALSKQSSKSPPWTQLREFLDLAGC